MQITFFIRVARPSKGYGTVNSYIVLEEYAKNSNAFEEKTTKAAEFIAENYSVERERESIVSAWEKILQR